MSNVLEEMKTRRSIRKFKPDAIPQEILDQIIEAGTYAANGRGAQNVIIIQKSWEVRVIRFTAHRQCSSF